MQGAQRVALLLRPGFSLLALAGLTDALAAANELQDSDRYACELISLSGGLLASATGALVQTAPLDPRDQWLAVFVIAPEPSLPEPAVRERLRQWAQAGVVLGGVDAGAALLAACGLLDGQRACADWTLLDSLAHQHAGVAWSSGLWAVSTDGLRLSCAGGLASLDLCAAWLATRHGERCAAELAAVLGLKGFRPQDERQRRQDDRSERGAASPKLVEALALMEANLGEPLPTEEVARLVGVSRRQLERLFKQHLDSLPSRHYLELRLARAQRLLQQSSQSILQIGLSSGFSSGPHFSNAYKSHFGHTPRDERSPRLRPLDGDSTP